jgi:phosphoribosylformylglycinamidine synthase
VLGPETAEDFGGSEWAASVHGLDGGRPPVADLQRAREVHTLVRDLVIDRVVAGVHDCSDGGLAVALVQMAAGGATGFHVSLDPAVAPAAWCFAETASRVVVAVDEPQLSDLWARAGAAGVRAEILGLAGGERLVADGAFDVSLDEAEAAWRGAIPRALGG